LTVAATRSDVLLSPAQHQGPCREVELDPLNLFLKLVLLTKYSADVTPPRHCPFPPQSGAGSEAVSFCQVRLFGEHYNANPVTLQLRKPSQIPRVENWACACYSHNLNLSILLHIFCYKLLISSLPLNKYRNFSVISKTTNKAGFRQTQVQQVFAFPKTAF